MGKGRVLTENGSRGWKEWNLQRWCKIKMIWTPAHEGIQGNERADEKAKEAAETGSSPHRKLPSFLRRKDLPISISATRQALKSNIKKRWKSEWKVSPRYPLASNVDYSLPSDEFIHIANQLRRNQASVLIQLRTGHLPLNNILFRIRRSDTPNCPHCYNNTRETLMHYIFFCPHYEQARRQLNAATNREKNAIGFLLGTRKGIPHLLRYIGDTGRLTSTFGNVTPSPEFTIKEKKRKITKTSTQETPTPT